MTKSVPNANFTFLGGQSVHESTDAKYLEYRRQWMENPKNFKVRDFPIHLDIEITNRCNLKCTFCDKLPLGVLELCLVSSNLFLPHISHSTVPILTISQSVQYHMSCASTDSIVSLLPDQKLVSLHIDNICP